MIVKLLTEHHLEFLSVKGGCRGLSEYSLVKMSKCWKSHALAHFVLISRHEQLINILIGLLNIINLVCIFLFLHLFCILTVFIKYILFYRLFAYCKVSNFNIHIWAWFGYFIC